MKLTINLQNSDLINSFTQQAKELKINLTNAKAETVLFSIIEQNSSNYFIFDTESSYLSKAISYIKRLNPYALICILYNKEETNLSLLKGDVYFYHADKNVDMFAYNTLLSFQNLHKSFSLVHKLTQKSEEPLKFGNAVYNPARRVISINNKEITQLSVKQGGVLEVLVQNLDNVVRKEIILEKVWHKNDYFASRSLDVYVTFLRKLFDSNGIKYQIKNITGKGLVLEKK